MSDEMTHRSLRATKLGKRFPGVVALSNVDLEIPRGKVIALVGANGAGKSTLIKILTGYYEEYEGQIEIEGQPVTVRLPSDAARYGIEAVYQEVDTVLVPYLTVTENLLIHDIAQQPRRFFINWPALHRQAKESLDRIGLDIDLRKRVEDLALHEKQMLVIARAVSQHVRYLIFDEPTTSLSLREVDRLFDVIRDLKQRGVGIIYISHRLAEVHEIADEIVVLRNGEKVTHLPNEEFDVARISEAMLGTAVTEAYPPKSNQEPGEVVLAVQNLNRRNTLHDINLEIRQGEILGVAGLVGAGKTELLRALFGADKIDTGEIQIDGIAQKIRSPENAVRQGVFLIPEERRSQGVLVEDSVRKNITLPFLQQFTWAVGLLNRFREISHARDIIAQVGLTPPKPDMPVKNLSGGNQQKVSIGKWFGQKPRVMMFDGATQGIDVKAKRDVYDLVQKMAQGAAIVFASSDIDEIIGIANRVIVMRDGKIAARLSQEELDRNLILAYATGTRVATEE